MARAAEEVGFDSLWVGDHLLYRDPVRGPWDALDDARLARGDHRAHRPRPARRVHRVPSARCARAHGGRRRTSSPAGRLVLGLGCGWNEVEFRAFGLPFDHLVSRFEEAFTIVRRLLAGEHVTFAWALPRRRRRGAPAQARDDAEADARRERAAHAVDRPAARRRAGTRGSRATATRSKASQRRTQGSTQPRSAPGATPRRSSGAHASSSRSRAAASATTTQARRRCPPARSRLTSKRSSRPGADEAILVADPITEASIRSLGTVIPTA